MPRSEASARAEGPTTPAPGRRRRRAARAALILGLVGLGLVLAHRPLLVGFARLFRVHDPAPSDALVVLSSSKEAAEFYRSGLAPTVLLVPTEPVPFPDLNENEVDRQILIRGGIPAGAIRVLPSIGPIGDLRQAASRVRDDARAHAMRRITVVTTALHTGRTRRIFREALRGTGVEVRMAAARDPLFDESDWYTRDEGLVAYFDETIQWLIDRLAP